MATWTNEQYYGGSPSTTYDGANLGNGANLYDDSTDSWDGKTITIWTNEAKNN